MYTRYIKCKQPVLTNKRKSVIYHTYTKYLRMIIAKNIYDTVGFDLQ
jgi:hypothetical protein